MINQKKFRRPVEKKLVVYLKSLKELPQANFELKLAGIRTENGVRWRIGQSVKGFE